MKTREMLAMAALALGLSLSSTSVASMLTVDNFSIGQNITDATANGTAVSSTSVGRTLSHNLLSFETSPTESTVGITGGKLDIHNEPGANSQVSVAWLLNAGLFSGTGNASLKFDILSSKNTASIKFLFNNAQFASFEIPGNTVNTPVSFALPPSQLMEINKGGILMLDTSGIPGWDLAIDNVGFSAEDRAANAPEPALMGLVGLSLTGLGLIRRKKRDQ